MIGFCYSYIRLEELFVGVSGIFIFVVSDFDDGKFFLYSIVLVYSFGDLGLLNFVNFL